MSGHKQPRVVIIGAGFGGLWAARALRNLPVEVTLVDRHNYHVFLPLLYQVATAELEPEEIAYPLRSLLRHLPNTQFILAEATDIDLQGRRIVTAAGPLAYDYLILGLGSESQFFNVMGAAEYAFSLKTLEQGIALRNHILERFESAAHEPDAERRRRALTFVVVGSGATGVEFTGALAELIRGPLAKDYPTLDFREVRLILLEAGDRMLPMLPERLQAYAQARLARLGVEIRLGAAASQITGEAVRLRDGSLIPTETVIWTAGVRGNSAGRHWGLPTTPTGQVAVLPTLQLPGHPEVYVIGDLAGAAGGEPGLPLTAPVAIQQGARAAQNIAQQLAGRNPQPFRFRDQGTMVTLGRNAAVAVLKGRSLTGFLAWIVWLGVHIYNLIGFRNRLFVLQDWAWDYLFYDRVVRLILPGAEPRLAPAALSPLSRGPSQNETKKEALGWRLHSA